MLEHIERAIAIGERSLINFAGKAGALRRGIREFQAQRHNWPRGNLDFFLQKMIIENVPDRIPLIESLCAGKDVLHVGCVDWPFVDPSSNLHLRLAGIARSLTGLDPDVKGLEVLKTHFPAGLYFSKAMDISTSFDVLLVPEVIEHVPNVGSFLSELDTIDFKDVLITGPNAIYRETCPWWPHTYLEGQTMTEYVHPDHNYYFSPYTLRKVVETLTPWEVARVGTTTLETSVFVQARKRRRDAVQ